MSNYLYNPRFTFLARCWWQASDTAIPSSGWADAGDRLSALWTETGSRGANGHYDRYLRGEPDGRLEKHLTPDLYQSPEHTYYELFWFGAYHQGRYAQDSPLHYDIRLVDRVWTVSRWRLDYNSSFLSGYVGIWKADRAHGALRKPAGERLWQLGGLDPHAMQNGSRHFNLQLLTPGGEPIRRYQRYDKWFFNSISGTPGFISLQVLSIPHHFGEI